MICSGLFVAKLSQSREKKKPIRKEESCGRSNKTL